jgi:hypothetical protein
VSALTDYSQDEIEKLIAAPMLVSMYVMGSSLSGPVGIVREMMAGVETAIDAGKNALPGSLFSELWSEQNMEAQRDKMQREAQTTTEGAQNMDQAKARMLDDIRAASTIMNAKGSSEESAAFKKLLTDAAQNVANAAKEGGFMGVGGVVINDAERRAMADIATAVGATA